ncbi:MAG: toxic anion resistance protein [Clostridiaceae bacterium]|nr:toxic anion resistance protein [Clostridiaceae bacterium]
MADLTLDSLLKDAKPNLENSSEVEMVAEIEQQVQQLSPEEQEKVNEIAATIDLKDTTSTNLYALEAQKNISSFSDSILTQVRSKDAGKTGELMTDLLMKVKKLDSPDDDKGFITKLFSSGKSKIQRYLAQYDDLSGQIDSIKAHLQSEQKELLKNIQLFDRLYDQNLNYFNDLQLYISAGEQKIQEMRNETLPRLYEEAHNSDNVMAVQVVSDLEENVNRFEKKVHDLKISQTLAMQTAPQIRLIQNNDHLLANKINDAVNNTIPLWKSQTVIALGLAKQEEVLEMQRSVSEATNQLIRENAEKLKQTTLGVREEAERSIVDVETLEKANQDLIETIQGSIEISERAKTVRLESEQKMLKIKNDLRDSLLEAMGDENAKKYL